MVLNICLNKNRLMDKEELLSMLQVLQVFKDKKDKLFIQHPKEL